MWNEIEKETDDNSEWIPNIKQTATVTNFRVTKEMIASWREFLDEAEKILKGDVLVPFWRGTNQKRGVNVNKAFMQPRNLDLVMWIHGAGAAPYLEEGKVTDPATWRRFNRVFRGDFLGLPSG